MAHETEVRPGESAVQKDQGFPEELQLKMATAFALSSVPLVEAELLFSREQPQLPELIKAPGGMEGCCDLHRLCRIKTNPPLISPPS